MGLDMFLKRKVFIGAEYEHRKVSGSIDITINGVSLPINFNKISYVEESAGYWRKANQIHNWFVTHVQEGKDNCEEYYVTREQLTELRNLCLQVLETKNTKLLQPVEGFFFGGTNIDEYYFKELEYTVDIINKLDLINDNVGEYYYKSSW